MWRKTFYTILFSVGLIAAAKAGRIDRAFDALAEYDYFKAKSLFEKSVKRFPVGAHYGLSLIYLNDKNPFHNLDSAYKFILVAESTMIHQSDKRKERLEEWGISESSINSSKQKVSSAIFKEVKQKHAIQLYQRFIDLHPWARELKQAIRNRNQLAFNQAKKANTFQAYRAFLTNYPDALEAQEAQERYDLLFYESQTVVNTPEAFKSFAKAYPESPYKADALDKVYSLSTIEGTKADYLVFIHQNPDNPNVNLAWSMVYKLSTDDYSPEAISEFLLDYPDYPYREEAFVDFQLAQMPYFPLNSIDTTGISRWGYIDSLGNTRVKPKYEYAGAFNDGLAAVSLNGKMGFINKRGEEVIPLVYDEVFPFKGGQAIVVKGDLMGALNSFGEVIVPIVYEDLGDFREGRAFALKDGYFGYLNTSGEIVIPFRYDNAYSFEDGYAKVKEDGKLGLINKQGELALPLKFELIYPDSGFIRLKQNDNWGVLRTFSDTLLPISFDFIGPLKNNRFMVVEDETYSYYNNEGDQVIGGKFDYTPLTINYGDFDSGYATYQYRGKFGIMDTTGNRIFPAIFDAVGKYGENLTPVKRYGKWGYANSDVRLKIKYQFEKAENFKMGYAIVTTKGKQGVIDTLGQWVVRPEYDRLSWIEDLYLQADTNGLSGALSRNGELILPIAYSRIEVRKTGFWNILNRGVMRLFHVPTRSIYSIEE